MRNMFRVTTTCLMALAMLTGTLFQSALAAPVTTEQLVAETRMETQRSEVRAFIERDEVRSQLMERGVDAAEAKQRIDSLSASELSMLYNNIDQLPAGEGALETAVFILVIFMLLDIAGVTDIFPGL